MGDATDSSLLTSELVSTQRLVQKEPDRRKVFIAIPSFWSIDPHFHQCMLSVMQEFRESDGGLEAQVMHSFGDSPNVGRSRNALTRHFLESDCTDLLFIDSDLVFNKAHIDRLINHEEEVVGGIYFKKQEGPPAACINSKKNPILKPSGLAEVAYIGTGFLRVRRSVFEKMILSFGEDIWYNTDTKPTMKEYNFWHLGVYKYPDGNRRWLSEDWWFCQRCADLGIQVWADRNVVLKHSGHCIYPLSYQRDEIFRQGGEPVPADSAVDAVDPIQSSTARTLQPA